MGTTRLLGVSAIGVVLLAGPAAAAVTTLRILDDFDIDQGPISVSGSESVQDVIRNPSLLLGGRQLSLIGCTGSATGTCTARVENGVLTVHNSGTVDTIIDYPRTPFAGGGPGAGVIDVSNTSGIERYLLRMKTDRKVFINYGFFSNGSGSLFGTFVVAPTNGLFEDVLLPSSPEWRYSKFASTTNVELELMLSDHLGSEPGNGLMELDYFAALVGPPGPPIPEPTIPELSSYAMLGIGFVILVLYLWPSERWRMSVAPHLPTLLRKHSHAR